MNKNNQKLVLSNMTYLFSYVDGESSFFTPYTAARSGRVFCQEYIDADISVEFNCNNYVHTVDRFYLDSFLLRNKVYGVSNTTYVNGETKFYCPILNVTIINLLNIFAINVEEYIQYILLSLKLQKYEFKDGCFVFYFPRSAIQEIPNTLSLGQAVVDYEQYLFAKVPLNCSEGELAKVRLLNKL
jgi:hypothetical protein